MIDSLLLDIATSMQCFPSIFVSFLNFLFCLLALSIFYKFFDYAGLCCYMVLSSILANIQILYVTSYEGFDMAILLGTVTFCSSFLACDIINKKHGAKMAKKALYLTIFSDIFFLISIILTIGHKPLDYSVFKDFSISQSTTENNVKAISQIFLPIPRLLIASYATYFLSQISEITLFNLIKKTRFIKSEYIKHNIVLFLSSVVFDTLLFTFFGLYLLSNEPLSARDFYEISISAIAIRTICNLGNTGYMKLLQKYKKL